MSRAPRIAAFFLVPTLIAGLIAWFMAKADMIPPGNHWVTQESEPDKQSNLIPMDATRGEIQSWILGCASHTETVSICIRRSNRLFREVKYPDATDDISVFPKDRSEP